jgi:hypothetical protein
MKECAVYECDCGHRFEAEFTRLVYGSEEQCPECGKITVSGGVFRYPEGCLAVTMGIPVWDEKR